jgi:2-polyprenyl-6-methoxyphenol hydroxylase-like FAD-dependent oxidoreductase
MGSLVAEKYFSEKGVFRMMGDAAHVFPPAGGFGLSTGLQDVYSLSRRLALHTQNQSSGSGAPDSLSTIGNLYQQE